MGGESAGRLKALRPAIHTIAHDEACGDRGPVECARLLLRGPPRGPTPPGRRSTSSSAPTATATSSKVESGHRWGCGTNAADQPDEYLMVTIVEGRGKDAVFLRIPHRRSGGAPDRLSCGRPRPDERRVGGPRVVSRPDTDASPFVRRVDHREAVLIKGPAGWGEFSPFPDYPPHVTTRGRLAAALEAACSVLPEPGRATIPVNVTVPAVAPEVAARLVLESGASTAKVKVGRQPLNGCHQEDEAPTSSFVLGRRSGRRARSASTSTQAGISVPPLSVSPPMPASTWSTWSNPSRVSRRWSSSRR